MNSTVIHHDHAIFREILQATSHPGTIFSLPTGGSITHENTALIQMLGCLMDNEVTFAIIGDNTGTMAEALTFHSGSARADISDADFIIAANGTTDGQLTQLKRGTLEYPDKGATVVYLIDAIAADGGTAKLSGPGIAGTVRPCFNGLAAAELTDLCKVNVEYPLGVDALFLDAHGRIASIPRSTRIGEQ